MTNTLKTWIYLIILAALMMTVGQALGGRQGLLLGFILALVVNFFSYFYSDKLVLSMYHAALIEGVDPYGLQDTVIKLSKRFSIPKPNVYIIPSETPNAFATGRGPGYASIAATEGILRLLNPEELEGVLAHELSHVRHKDTLIMAIAATLGTVIMFIANSFRWLAVLGDTRERNGRSNAVAGLFLAFLAPIAASLIQLSISRSREFEADQAAAGVTQNPQALASALWKIHNYSQAMPMPATHSTAHMFIINPLLSGGINNLFSTHPPVQERIRKLIGRTL